MMKKIYTLLIALFFVGEAMGQGNSPNSVGVFDAQRQVYNNNTYVGSDKLDSIGIWVQLGPFDNDILGFAFGDNNADTIYAGSRENGVYRTIDGGESWQQTNNGIVGNFIRAIGVNPTNLNSILAGTFYNGLYKSSNGGELWQSIPDVQSSTILNIEFNPVNGDTVYVSTIDKGVYRSWNGGGSWELVTPDNINISLRVFIDPNHTNRVYFVSEDTLFRSLNYGNTWEPFYTGPGGADVFSMAIEYGNSDIIYIGTDNTLVKTVDGGNNWEKLLDTIEIILDIIIDIENCDIVYLASPSTGVYKSENGGYDWEHLDHGGAYLTMLYLKFHPQSNDILYACTNGYGLLRTDELATFIDAREIPTKESISIYPNPAYSSLSVELLSLQQEETFVSFSNLNGQQILIQPIIEPKTEIDITHLPAGIYIVKVWNDRDVMVQKIIKQ